MPQADAEELTAYHEAGHAIMGVACGGTLVHVSIEPPNDDGPKRFGESIVRWPRMQTAVLTVAEIKVSLAGPIAELTFDGARVPLKSCPEFVADWRYAVAAASRSPEAEKLLSLVEADLWEFFALDYVWAATAAVADSLLAHETLEHDEVYEIWQFWKHR